MDVKGAKRMTDFTVTKLDGGDFAIVPIPIDEDIYFGGVLQERYGQPLTDRHKEQLKKILDMIEFLKAYNFSCVVDTNNEMKQIDEALRLLEGVCKGKL